MAFKFSLATVLRIRVIVEEREERTLQKILYEIGQAVQTIAGIDAELARINDDRRTDVFKPLVAGALNLSYNDVEALRQSRKNTEAVISELEQQRLRQLQVYAAARRDREMLTDMRADKRNAYEADLATREQKTLDDNYIARMRRK